MKSELRDAGALNLNRPEERLERYDGRRKEAPQTELEEAYNSETEQKDLLPDNSETETEEERAERLRVPTDEELADQYGLTVEQVKHIFRS